MNTSNLYPYLRPGPPGPDWADTAVHIGHGVYAHLLEDRETDTGIVHAAVDSARLREAGLTAEEAHRLALENLTRFADTDQALSIQVLGNPGDPVHFLLYSDHPRAAACLRLPDLYEQASELLESAGVCALVPQEESLVVLPMRDRAYREMLVGKLRAIEADVVRPISFALFELSASGPRPFSEPD